MWGNISGDQLGEHAHLPRLVERCLSEAGLAASTFGLEISERRLIRRADDAASDLVSLRALGVSLAVDDFGTGYASLDYLRRFIFDEIKIDQGLGRRRAAGQDRTDTAVTSSIIALGRSLDLVVLAGDRAGRYDQLAESRGATWDRGT